MRRLPLLALLLLLPVPTSAAPITLTTCGMLVTGHAQLTGDLDCSSHPGHAVVLDGTLALNGHTLIGNTTDLADYSAVDCTGKCRVKVKGPGTIVGGYHAVRGANVNVTNEVIISNAGAWGISGATVKVLRSWVHDCGGALAVDADGGGGITAGMIIVTKSTVAANASFGVNATVRAALRHVDVSQNGVADVRSFEKPSLVDTTCFTSRRESLAETWNVCFGD
jgi:hypothetical protein